MNRKLKLALAALLGFSAACSSVKNAPKESKDKQESDQVAPGYNGGNPRITVMYGVRTPEGKMMVKPIESDSLQKATAKSQNPELDPVLEKVED